MQPETNYQKKQRIAEQSTQGKIPPQVIDFEKAILGALLLEKEAVYDVVNLIKPEMFYDEAHAQIYRSMLNLYHNKRPIDILTVTQQLRTDGTLELVGGGYTVTELTARVSGSSNMEFWCRILTEKYLARELIRKSQEIIRDAYDDTADTFDILSSMGTFVAEAETGFIGSNESHVADLALEVMTARENAPTDNHNITGIPTGIYELDKLIDGLIPGELITIGARPAMGKTAVICSIAQSINYDFKTPLAIFSLEMSRLQIFLRLETNFSGISAKKIKANSLTEAERILLSQTDMKIANGSIIIDDSSSLNVNQLISRIKMFVRKYGIKVVLLDYLQLLASLGIKGGNREADISYATRALKVCAQELKIPIVILCQLSRQVESRRPFCFPSLADLRESGAIEQDSDKVIFLWRPEYYLTEEMQHDSKLKIGTTTNFRLFNKNIDNKNLLVFIVAKHREGELGNVPALFTPWNMRVANHPALTEMPTPPEASTVTIPVVNNISKDYTIPLFPKEEEEDLPF